jgi:hypothetical protein
LLARFTPQWFGMPPCTDYDWTLFYLLALPLFIVAVIDDMRHLDYWIAFLRRLPPATRRLTERR